MRIGRSYCVIFPWIFLSYITGILSYETELVTKPQLIDIRSHSSSALVFGQRTPRQADGWCILPPQLQNGRYTASRNRCRPEDMTPACQSIPGAYVFPDWVLYFKCDPTYKLSTTNTIAVCYKGRWVPRLPTCQDNCTHSDTLVNGKRTCKGEVIFEETFSGPFSEKWKHVVMIPDSPDYEFNLFRLDKENSFIRNETLVIKPTLYDDNEVRGEVTLDGCTATEESGKCSLKAVAYLIVPPVASARINTRESFSFRYGTVEIRAKLPKGDWLTPELWLEPRHNFYGSKYHSGRIQIVFSRGNSEFKCDGEDYGLQQLESGVLMGPERNVRKRSVRMRVPDTWYDSYHNYTLVWTPDKITFKVDNEEAKEIVSGGQRLCQALDFTQEECVTWSSGSMLAPFDQDFFITLGLSVGSIRDFPDNCINRGKAKQWKNNSPKRLVKFWQDRENWQPTWSDDDSSLHVDHVRVTAL